MDSRPIPLDKSADSTQLDMVLSYPAAPVMMAFLPASLPMMFAEWYDADVERIDKVKMLC